MTTLLEGILRGLLPVAQGSSIERRIRIFQAIDEIDGRWRMNSEFKLDEATRKLAQGLVARLVVEYAADPVINEAMGSGQENRTHTTVSEWGSRVPLREIQKARAVNEQLGFGISLMQADSNAILKPMLETAVMCLVDDRAEDLIAMGEIDEMANSTAGQLRAKNGIRARVLRMVGSGFGGMASPSTMKNLNERYPLTMYRILSFMRPTAELWDAAWRRFESGPYALYDGLAPLLRAVRPEGSKIDEGWSRRVMNLEVLKKQLAIWAGEEVANWSDVPILRERYSMSWAAIMLDGLDFEAQAYLDEQADRAVDLRRDSVDAMVLQMNAEQFRELLKESKKWGQLSLVAPAAIEGRRADVTVISRGTAHYCIDFLRGLPKAPLRDYGVPDELRWVFDLGVSDVGRQRFAAADRETIDFLLGELRPKQISMAERLRQPELVDEEPMSDLLNEFVARTVVGSRDVHEDDVVAIVRHAKEQKKLEATSRCGMIMAMSEFNDPRLADTALRVLPTLFEDDSHLVVCSALQAIGICLERLNYNVSSDTYGVLSAAVQKNCDRLGLRKFERTVGFKGIQGISELDLCHDVLLKLRRVRVIDSGKLLEMA